MKGRVHELKIQQKYFTAVLWGKKPFEIRKNDRGFKVGDFLALNEIDDEGKYTNHSVIMKVTYVLDDNEYLKDGYVALGIERCSVMTEDEFLEEARTVHLDPNDYYSGKIATRCECDG